MGVVSYQPAIEVLASKVSELNREIARFYETYGNTVRVHGRVNYRIDTDDPYFEVEIEVSEIIALVS